MANEWDNLHRLYAKRLSSSSRASSQNRNSRKGSVINKNSRNSRDGTLRSRTIKSDFNSSPESTPSTPRTPKASEFEPAVHDSGSNAPKSDSNSVSSYNLIPTYINVQWKPMQSGGSEELTESDIIDPDILKPKKKKKKRKKKKDDEDTEEEVSMDEGGGDSGQSTDQLLGVDERKPGDNDPFAHMEKQVTHGGHKDKWSPAKQEELLKPKNPASVADQVCPVSPIPRFDEDCILTSNSSSSLLSSIIEISSRYETTFPVHLQPKEPENPSNSSPKHDYANIMLFDPPGQSSTDGGTTLPKAPTHKSPKKPFPMTRKRTKSEDLLEMSSSNSSLPNPSSTSSKPSSVATSTSNKPPSGVKKKPIPPQKPSRFLLYDKSSPEKEHPVSDRNASGRARSHSESKCEEDKMAYEHGAEETATDELSEGKHSPSTASSRTNCPSSSMSALDLSSAIKAGRDGREASAEPLNFLKVYGTYSCRTKDQSSLSPPHPSSSSHQLPRSRSVDIPQLDPAVDSHTHQRAVTTSGRRPPPSKPPRDGISRGGLSNVSRKGSSASGGAGGEVNSKETNELMRKLSLRRMKIDEEISVNSTASKFSNPDSSGSGSMAADSLTEIKPDAVMDATSERNSGVSLSSVQSELVVAYHSKALGAGDRDGQVDMTTTRSSNASSNGGSYGVDGPDVTLTSRKDEGSEDHVGSLATYGIMEEFQLGRGSYAP